MSTTWVVQPRTKAFKATPLPKTQPAGGWRFVNLSEPKQSKDKSIRKFVRSNATRHYRQIKKKQNDLKYSRQSGDTTLRHEISDSSVLPVSKLPTPARLDHDGVCFISCGNPEYEHECRYSSSRIRSSPRQLLGNGCCDPFDASPIGVDRRYSGYVLDHCELPSHSPLERTGNPICIHPLTRQ